MAKVAILACAGWKGAAHGTPHAHLPAPFLPLGDGTTCASRLAAQFRRFGYDVALTAGPVGYPFKAYQPRHEFRTQPEYRGMSPADIASLLGVDPDAAPWTDALHRYIRKLGRLIVTEAPGWTSKHDSFCTALDQLVEYDRCVMTCGDTLYRSDFLARVLRQSPWPCQFSICPFHAIFMLDERGKAIYRGDAQNHRWRETNPRSWDVRMNKYPDAGEGSGRLARAGIPHHGWHTLPWVGQETCLWMDIDGPGDYETAQERIAQGYYG